MLKIDKVPVYRQEVLTLYSSLIESMIPPNDRDSRFFVTFITAIQKQWKAKHIAFKEILHHTLQEQVLKESWEEVYKTFLGNLKRHQFLMDLVQKSLFLSKISANGPWTWPHMRDRIIDEGYSTKCQHLLNKFTFGAGLKKEALVPIGYNEIFSFLLDGKTDEAKQLLKRWQDRNWLELYSPPSFDTLNQTLFEEGLTLSPSDQPIQNATENELDHIFKELGDFQDLDKKLASLDIRKQRQTFHFETASLTRKIGLFPALWRTFTAKEKINQACPHQNVTPIFSSPFSEPASTDWTFIKRAESGHTHPGGELLWFNRKAIKNSLFPLDFAQLQLGVLFAAAIEQQLFPHPYDQLSDEDRHLIIELASTAEAEFIKMGPVDPAVAAALGFYGFGTALDKLAQRMNRPELTLLFSHSLLMKVWAKKLYASLHHPLWKVIDLFDLPHDEIQKERNLAFHHLTAVAPEQPAQGFAIWDEACKPLVDPLHLLPFSVLDRIAPS